MSEVCGIPVSTLSKIENDKLTLAYDKLQSLSHALGIPFVDLFVEDRADSPPLTGRRSVATLASATRVETTNYVYNYFCTDLRKRLMVPVHVVITAQSLEEFGDLIRHAGEEFTYVIRGAVEFHSELYSPLIIREGEGVYIDSNMGHAYLVADGFEEAVVLSVCASAEEDLQQQLIADAEARTELEGQSTPISVKEKSRRPRIVRPSAKRARSKGAA